MKKLENAWEFKFNLIWDDNIRSLNTFDENMKTGLRLFQFMGEFRTKGKRLLIQVSLMFL